MRAFYAIFTALLLVLTAEVSATARDLAEVAPSSLAPTPAIVGGVAAPQGRLPYMVFIYGGVNTVVDGWPTDKCGGVLVRGDMVLTSASCLCREFGRCSDYGPGNPPLTDLFAIPGAYSIDTSGDGGGWLAGSIAVKEVYRHPNYEQDFAQTASNVFGFLDIPFRAQYWDAALLVLSKCPAATAKTIPLATQAEVSAAGTMMAAGWGRTSLNADPDFGTGGARPKILQVATMTPVPLSNCQPLTYLFCYFSGVIENECPKVLGNVCAAGTTRNPVNGDTPPLQAPCEQDEGGPLVLNKANAAAPLSGAVSEDRLVGLSSWGIGCGLNNLPHVFTSMAAQRTLDWFNGKLAQIPDACPSVTAPPPPPPPPTNTTAPAPIAAGPLGSFAAAASTTKPWAGKAKLLKVPKGTTDTNTFCANLCLGRPCSAFSVLVKGRRGARQSAVFAVASNLCTDGQRKPPICRRVATGSFKKNT